MAPRGRTLLLPLAATTILVASTIFLLSAPGARWRPADPGLPAPIHAATSSDSPVPGIVTPPSISTGSKGLSFLDENGRPDDPAAARCDPRGAAVRVFVYDMPPEFHFGLLGWAPPTGAGDVWPDLAPPPRYPGGLNQQHSVAYWLTLDCAYFTRSSLYNHVRYGRCPLPWMINRDTYMQLIYTKINL
jgi:hypothetical protein